MSVLPKDQEDRDLATTTFDRNVVVTAGAGTGKTTLLIHRLLHLLIREPGAIPITQLVALTFTNKSANEMKLRLRSALEKISTEDEPSEIISTFISKYGLSKALITHRATEAIRDLERSQICTIHHFAASLLRLYPFETEVDPLFQIDEESGQFERRFQRCWQNWLEKELASDGPRKNLWQNAFETHSLSEMEQVALKLVSENVPLSQLQDSTLTQTVPIPVQKWLKTLESACERLLSAHPENRKIERAVAAAKSIFCIVRENGSVLESDFETEEQLITSNTPGKVKGWEDDEYKEAKHIIQIARPLFQIDPETITNLITLLSPFIRRFQEYRLREGGLSFDALLVKARDLLRDYPAIREALKHRYHAILIDEFQDTDPVQYEILLYLAETPLSRAGHWQAVQLLPGKLFVVGDPKQSIYGFRRADIEAYHTVREMILKQNGIHCTLRTNFRSHKKILDTVNGVLSPVMTPKPGFQPEYIPIDPAPIHKNTEQTNPFRAVSFQLLHDLTMDAETAKQYEGEAIVQWLKTSVLGHQEIMDANGTIRRVQKGDVAILLRSLTGIHYLLEPLRQAGISYRVEGERHFYSSPAVIDAVNLLRSVADPNDQIALVGVLRSPLGGFTDAEIYTLHQAKQFHYRGADIDDSLLLPDIKPLYHLLKQLHEVSATLPPGDAVAHIFETAPLTLLSAATRDGEQALANLNKLKQQARILAETDGLSFRAIVDVLKRAVLDDIDEAESPLAEEGVDAVRIMSIHKSKGLEFPVVILAFCQSGNPPGERDQVVIRQDWSTNLTGIRMGGSRDLASVYLAEKTRLREIEEEKRVLYVAMTRAREHLRFSAAYNGRLSGGSLLTHVQEALGETENLLEDRNNILSLGEGAILKQLVSKTEPAALSSPTKIPPQDPMDLKRFTKTWAIRRKACETLQKTLLFTSPTQAINQAETFMKGGIPSEESRVITNGKLIGNLAHRFLERWDFSSDIQQFSDRLHHFLNGQPASEMAEDADRLFSEMLQIFKVFFHSAPYRELAGSTILGREVPFLIPWEEQVLKGTIDMLYEREGRLYIADYKTDRVQPKDLKTKAQIYQPQLRHYRTAVQCALKREVAGLKLIFLRLGAEIELPND